MNPSSPSDKPAAAPMPAKKTGAFGGAAFGTALAWVRDMDFQKISAQFRTLLRDDVVRDDIIANETDALHRQKRILTLLNWQAYTSLGLVIAVIFLFPLLRPYYTYRTISPQQEMASLIALDQPNVTKRALLSWAATSITEILTLGFGDFDQQLMAQRSRFTSDGWDGFRDSLRKQGLRQEFKSRQLVLTTVPSNTPVVVAEGVNEEKIYQWNVEMPVIMTFLTNNDVKKRQASLISLEIVRVPAKENIQGIAIRAWHVIQ